MTDTNRLLTITTPEGSDLLRLWDQSLGGDAALSLTNLATYLAGLSSSAPVLATQITAPASSGFSVTVSAANTWLIIVPTGAFAAGTIVLPTGVDKGEVLVTCTQAITTLTVSNGTTYGAPTSLSANGFFRLRYDASLDVWGRVG